MRLKGTLRTLGSNSPFGPEWCLEFRSGKTLLYLEAHQIHNQDINPQSGNPQVPTYPYGWSVHRLRESSRRHTSQFFISFLTCLELYEYAIFRCLCTSFRAAQGGVGR